MKDWLNGVYQLTISIHHFLVVCWRWRTGRFFYFRDRPQWFVELFASGLEGRLEHDEFLAPMVHEAEQERRVRTRT